MQHSGGWGGTHNRRVRDLGGGGGRVASGLAHLVVFCRGVPQGGVWSMFGGAVFLLPPVHRVSTGGRGGGARELHSLHHPHKQCSMFTCDPMGISHATCTIFKRKKKQLTKRFGTRRSEANRQRFGPRGDRTTAPRRCGTTTQTPWPFGGTVTALRGGGAPCARSACVWGSGGAGRVRCTVHCPAADALPSEVTSRIARLRTKAGGRCTARVFQRNNRRQRRCWGRAVARVPVHLCSRPA